MPLYDSLAQGCRIRTMNRVGSNRGTPAATMCLIAWVFSNCLSAQAQQVESDPVDSTSTISFRGLGGQVATANAGTVRFSGWGTEAPADNVGTISFSGWGAADNEDSVGTIAFTGVGSGSLESPVRVSFSGWNRSMSASDAVDVRFEGWAQRLSPSEVADVAFAGWNRQQPIPVQDVTFEGWNHWLAPGLQTVSFTGMGEQPPPCHPSDLLEGRSLALPTEGDNGNLYQMFTCETDWHTAASACESVGAHLMTITSREEQAIATGFAGDCGYCWLGLTDADSEGNFSWITGEPLGYTNWAGGEPNEYCEAEDYVHMHPAGDWNDQQADGGCSSWGLMRYVCEWERD